MLELQVRYQKTIAPVNRLDQSSVWSRRARRTIAQIQKSAEIAAASPYVQLAAIGTFILVGLLTW